MSRNTSTAIYKQDRPYPLVSFEGKLYLQVGVMFVITDEDSDEIVDGKKVLGYHRSQEAYPIIATSTEDIGRTICTETTGCMGCNHIHEGEKVNLTSLYYYFENNFYSRVHIDDKTDEIDYVPSFSPLSTAIAFQEYGCIILSPADDIIKIDLFITVHGSDKYYLETDEQPCFFCVPLLDVYSTAKKFLSIIKDYSDIVGKKLKFVFTCTEKYHYYFPSYQTRDNYIKELNEYIQVEWAEYQFE